MELTIVHPNFIDRAWRDGASSLAQACKRSGGEVTADQLRMRLARGELTLLCWRDGETPKAWAAVTFEQHPNLRCLFVYAISASGHCYAETFDALKQYARDDGASRIRGACDPAVSRLWQQKFGFTEAYRIMEMEV